MRILMLMLIPLMLMAQEAAPDAVAVDGMPVWLQGLIALVATLVTTVLVPWLRKKTKAEMVLTKDNLLSYVRNEALLLVANIAERDLPIIAKKIQDGSLNSRDEVKALLYSLGDKALDQLKKQFHDQGIDLVKEFGEHGLRRVIRWAADKINPFPGKETAATLVETGADILLDKGIEYARTRWLTEEAQK